MNRQKSKIKVTSRIRFTIFIAIVMILSVAIINIVIGLNKVTGTTEKQYIQVEVSAGDTLWDIANSYTHSENKDLRQSVYEICQVNDISANELSPGMTIDVPKDL